MSFHSFELCADTFNRLPCSCHRRVIFDDMECHFHRVKNKELTKFFGKMGYDWGGNFSSTNSIYLQDLIDRFKLSKRIITFVILTFFLKKILTESKWFLFFKILLKIIILISNTGSAIYIGTFSSYESFQHFAKGILKQMIHQFKALIELHESGKKLGMASSWGGPRPLNWKSTTSTKSLDLPKTIFFHFQNFFQQ